MRLFLCFFVFFLFSYADIDRFNERMSQIQSLSPSLADLNTLQNPFSVEKVERKEVVVERKEVVVERKEVVVERKPKEIILSAIFGNRAFLNGNWYSQNDVVEEDFKLIAVFDDGVILKGSDSRDKVLKLTDDSIFKVRVKQ